MLFVLYNPLANSNQGEKAKDEILPILKEKYGEDITVENVIGINVDNFLGKLTKEDKVILLGGDGTINRFANAIYDKKLPCSFYLYKAGTGNDFLRDVEDKIVDNLLEINEYVKNLPLVIVNDREYRYLNGIGYGIDGMVCERADKMKDEGAENINYTTLSIKLLLKGYNPPNAKITVDGETKEYNKVWLASTMNGRFYGGGMMPCPNQDRLSNKVSVLCFYGTNRFQTLLIFPKLFKGTHVAHKKHIEIRSGKEVTVEFDAPNALQIDGETITNVLKYKVIKK